MTPSSWLDEIRSLSGQSGQVSILFSCSGGCGMISKLVTDSALLPDRCADAVGAGVAAADDDDFLALGKNRFDVALRLVAHAPVLLRQKIHREMDAVQARGPEIGRSRGFSLPPVSTTASCCLSNLSTGTLTPISVL